MVLYPGYDLESTNMVHTEAQAQSQRFGLNWAGESNWEIQDFHLYLFSGVED